MKLKSCLALLCLPAALAAQQSGYVTVSDGARLFYRTSGRPGPGIDTLSWDPSGPRLLTGSLEGEVSVWGIPGGQRIRRLREAGKPIDAVAFSPNGRLVVAASRTKPIQLRPRPDFSPSTSP